SGGNTFTLSNTLGSNGFSSTPFNLFTGAGSDTVNVFRMMTGGTLNIEGQSGFDTVNCGQNGLTAGLRGTINISNAAQYTQLSVDDSADSAARTIALDAIGALPGDTHPRGQITGVVPGVINYRAYDMQDPITIKAGSGGNTVVVNNTPVKTIGYVGGNTINL